MALETPDFYRSGTTTMREEALTQVDQFIANAKLYRHTPKHIVDMLEQMTLMARCAEPAFGFWVRAGENPGEYLGTYPVDEGAAMAAAFVALGVPTA